MPKLIVNGCSICGEDVRYEQLSKTVGVLYCLECESEKEIKLDARTLQTLDASLVSIGPNSKRTKAGKFIKTALVDAEFLAKVFRASHLLKMLGRGYPITDDEYIELYESGLINLESEEIEDE